MSLQASRTFASLYVQFVLIVHVRTRLMPADSPIFQVLDGVIVVCAIILNPRARRRRERETDTLCGTMEVVPSEPVASGTVTILSPCETIDTDLEKGTLQHEVLGKQATAVVAAGPSRGSAEAPEL